MGSEGRGGRAPRQPGQVRKEAAVTSSARVVVGLPPCFRPAGGIAASTAADANFRATACCMSDQDTPTAAETDAKTGGGPAVDLLGDLVDGGDDGYKVLARKYRPQSFDD